jgi:hypothetical protein
MGLDTQERKAAKYFVGTEVENTAMKGEETLFVVGVQPWDEIEFWAEKHVLRHLYFGTSQSFTPDTSEDYIAWEEMIIPLLKKGYWCTLDFDVAYAEGVLESGYDEYNTFISMISVKLPYIRQFNYNATLKLDDTTWGHSNQGVWCHNLHELQRRRVYTDWKDYVGDTTIE